MRALRRPMWRASRTTPTTSISCSAKDPSPRASTCGRLRRVPPTPAVLYRDPSQTTLSATAPGPTTLSLSNPADGFTSSATVTLQSATLGFFAPSGTTLSPNPDQAVLSVVLDAEFPNDPNDPTGSGHYLGRRHRCPPSAQLHPTGGGAIPAIMSDAGDTTGKGNSDDGLFDATYSFLVPATLTTGTLDGRRRIVQRGGVHALHRRVGHHHARHHDTSDPGAQLPRTGGRGGSAHPAVGRPA